MLHFPHQVLPEQRERDPLARQSVQRLAHQLALARGDRRPGPFARIRRSVLRRES